MGSSHTGEKPKVRAQVNILKPLFLCVNVKMLCFDVRERHTVNSSCTLITNIQ